MAAAWSQSGALGPARVYKAGPDAARHALSQGVRIATIVVRRDAALSIPGFRKELWSMADEEYRRPSRAGWRRRLLSASTLPVRASFRPAFLLDMVASGTSSKTTFMSTRRG